MVVEKTKKRSPAKHRLNLGQGRIPDRTPIAVIDIGSNSVRQVVYEGLSRAPAVLFNEKILCGLGKGLLKTKKLNPKGVERALAAVTRFMALGNQIGVSDTLIIATAAARDAKNGPDFIARVEELTGCHVEILTGAMEARYAALGVKSGFFKPCGIVGDMGGGSLELVTIKSNNGSNGLGEGITLPLGGLWLREASGESIEKARKIVRKALAQVQFDWPEDNVKTFYAIGGTWRSLGKLHIASSKHPLQGVHDYEIKAKEMKRFAKKMLKQELAEVTGIGAVSSNRRSLLPFGAVVIEEIIRHFKPERVAFSSLGVREGLLFSRLSEDEQEKDSLISAAYDFAVLRARSAHHCLELADWTSMAFHELGIEENENEKRYRIAACYLADLGWRAHPDFRAKQAQEIIANAGFVAIDHEGRAYLALSNYHRYKGLGSKVKPLKLDRIVSKKLRKKARILAAMFRILYLFSASMPGIIPQMKLKKTGKKSAELIIPEEIAALVGERPYERIRQFDRETGVEITLKIETGA